MKNMDYDQIYEIKKQFVCNPFLLSDNFCCPMPFRFGFGCAKNQPTDQPLDWYPQAIHLGLVSSDPTMLVERTNNIYKLGISQWNMWWYT